MCGNKQKLSSGGPRESSNQIFLVSNGAIPVRAAKNARAINDGRQFITNGNVQLASRALLDNADHYSLWPIASIGLRRLTELCGH
jgi:hypothetical protein